MLPRPLENDRKRRRYPSYPRRLEKNTWRPGEGQQKSHSKAPRRTTTATEEGGEDGCHPEHREEGALVGARKKGSSR